MRGDVSKRTHIVDHGGGNASPMHRNRSIGAGGKNSVKKDSFACPTGPLLRSKIVLDIPAHPDIERTQDDMTSGHIVTAVHDQ